MKTDFNFSIIVLVGILLLASFSLLLVSLSINNVINCGFIDYCTISCIFLIVYINCIRCSYNKLQENDSDR